MKIKSKFAITIEPPIFLINVGILIQAVVMQNMFLDKVCMVNLQLNASQCDLHSNDTNSTDELRDQVQSYVSTLNIYGTVINCIPSIFFVLFLGPWSDKHGRKPLMIFPTIGWILSTLISMANYHYKSWPAEYLLFAAVPVSLLGGWSSLGMAVSSYLVDTSTEETRTTRLSIFSGVVMTAGPVGNLISGYIYQYGGYWAVFGSSLGLTIVALTYIIVFVHETRSRPSVKQKPEADIKDEHQKVKLGILKNLWHCFLVTFKPRIGHRRACLIILLMMMCISTFSNSPEGVGYLYARKKLGWDAPDFTLYLTFYFSVMVFGSLVLLPLLTGYFKVSDGVIGVVGLAGNIAAYLAIAFVTSGLMLYISTLGLVLTVGIGVVIRSILSKLIPAEELGHVYSVAACFESINPLVASASINLIYKATLEVFPGCVFLVGACCDLISIALFASVLLLQQNEMDGNQDPPADNIVEMKTAPTQCP